VNKIYTGDCRDVMRALIAGGVKVQTVVTSPPYWGLRNYKIPPTVWGGDPDCRHEWGAEGRWRRTGGTSSSTLGQDCHPNGVDAEDIIEKVRRSSLNASAGAFCRRCGAWRGDLGLEPTPWMYVAHMVEVFDLVRELLEDDGTLWLNLGDCYASDGGVLTPHSGMPRNRRRTQETVSGAVRWRTGKSGNKGNGAAGEVLCRPNVALLKEIIGSDEADPGARYRPFFDGVKQKDLMGLPWAVAMALRASGWWLRSDIIWHKRNPMPGSYKDRPTSTHEYVFLLAKRDRYYYDWEAIAEACSPNTHARLSQDVMAQLGSDRANDGARRGGRRMNAMHGGVRGPKDDIRADEGLRTSDKFGRGRGWRAPGVTPKSAGLDRSSGVRANASFHQNHSGVVERRNKRSVWEIGSEPYKGAHTATFPQALVEPCVLAGSRPGQIVFDPFVGTGTVPQVAARLGRQYIGCDVNPENEPLQRARVRQHGLELA